MVYIIFWHSILAFYLAFYLTFFSGILSGIYSDTLFWHSIVYLRRIGVVEGRTLWSGARGCGPAGNTLIRSLRWRSGGEHWDLELADEVRRTRRTRRRRRKAGQLTRNLYNNPHLTGGEWHSRCIPLIILACWWIFMRLHIPILCLCVLLISLHTFWYWHWDLIFACF